MAGAIGATASCVFCEIAATKSTSHSILHSDDRVVAFRDINPSAFRHYLVVPVEHIPTVNDLQRKTEDHSLVNHMLEVGRMLLVRDAPQSKQYRFGFHQPPLNSVNHLHLHCFALPYTPSRWRCIKYLSFGPLGFIEAEKFLEKIKPLPAVHSKV
ncbi:bifunctional adenosine 5'-phosphosulfate phosphorylase/adenylylsulfatase HINT4 isoform X1 [Cicer arietinum]|uniref:Bifunctional adenosine 5'-phosphosulfate phosphorylase/adenylylsulfatase HINT4 isoform X1 n=1 Tax=Cicer arietinum TaxID=3827 RepID=A0A1S2YXW1_CICAR|nr:bifunctional adenosine 5'-phosphosulfate phosphorylase/adenylylsulfatase HINT4 isoform X1 [Cicer arietinum]